MIVECKNGHVHEVELHLPPIVACPTCKDSARPLLHTHPKVKEWRDEKIQALEERAKNAHAALKTKRPAP